MPLIVQSSLAPQRPILLATKRGSDRIGFLYAKKDQIKNGLWLWASTITLSKVSFSKVSNSKFSPKVSKLS